MIQTELAGLFRRDLGRLLRQIAAFPDDGSLWRSGPGGGNAAGNLVLHLEGNLREYIGRQLGGLPFERKRDLEFSSSGLAASELRTRIEAIAEAIPAVVARLTDADVDGRYPEVVLETPMTTRELLIHLHGHLTFHLGQIDSARRALGWPLGAV